MKFAVHCAPSVNSCTPGWIVAVLAGAHAEATDGTRAKTPKAATANRVVRALRCIVVRSSRPWSPGAASFPHRAGQGVGLPGIWRRSTQYYLGANRGGDAVALVPE